MTGYTVPLAELRMKDVESVGGKNASLGEMIGRLSGAGVRVPADSRRPRRPTATSSRRTGSAARIAGELAALDVDDVARLAEAGARIRGWILDTRFQPALEREVLAAATRLGNGGSAVAVRSSATAEDLPERVVRRSAGNDPERSRGPSRCLRPCTRSMRRSTTTARSRTARTRASTTRRSRSRSACSTWCAATSARAASCSRSTPSRDSARRSSSPRPGASASWSCRAP